MEERITLIFNDDGNKKEVQYDCVIKQGLSGARSVKKILDYVKKYGDPIKIIGDGYWASLMRKQYDIFQSDPKGYKGVPKGDILKGASITTGLSLDKIQDGIRNFKKRLKV